jgi:hypothetical protein
MNFCDWLSLAWYHIVASQNLDHFKAGVSVTRVRSWGGVLSYCSKYMAKLGENNFLSDVPVGRSWGIFNRSSIPWAKMLDLDLDEETGVRIRRICRHYLTRVTGRKRRFAYGCTLYCDTRHFLPLLARPPDTPF